MLKKTYVEPHEGNWDGAQEKYFYHEDAQSGRRKINEEDLDSLGAGDEQEEQER